MEGQGMTALFEHQFWLQIMGDHARFILMTLSPTEAEHIKEAERFMQLFDALLKTARGQLTAAALIELNRQAYDTTYNFKKFKLQLLALTLRSKLKISLTSTFFNHMLNELDEYLLTINSMPEDVSPVFHPLHYNTVWLSDAVGHAASISATLDEIEKDYIEAARDYEKQFTDLYMKTVELNGYTRTNIQSFPALNRLNHQADATMARFKAYLENILQLRLNGTLLGTLMPLMADHMAREECYYLTKLSQSAGNIPSPDCDPAKERVEG